MKTRALILLFSFAFLFSCQIFNDKKNSPEYVSKAFLQHIQKLEFEEAKTFATEETKMMLTFFANITKLVPDSQRIPTKQTDVLIQNCVVQGETAQCSYTANGKEQVIDLVKQDKKWLVDMKKENERINPFK